MSTKSERTTNARTTDRRHRAIDLDLGAINSADWPSLGRALHAAVLGLDTRRDLRHWESGARDAIPDGFPTTASGGNAGGSGGSPSSIVERTSSQRTRVDDPATKLLDQAMSDLAILAGHARKIEHTLSKFAELRDASGLKPDEPGCWALDRVGGWEPIHATTIVNGSPYSLGRWAYDFTLRNGVLPSVAQCKAHTAGRKVFVPASSKAVAS